VCAAAGLFGVPAFVLALGRDLDGIGASFAAGLLCLTVAGACGPWLVPRERGERGARPALRALARSLAFAGAAAAACAFVAWRRDGPVAAAAAVGAFSGLYAFVAAVLADLLRGGLTRVGVAAVAVALLLTLAWWDDPFLLAAHDRKASAALAFRLSAAAAASVTLDFDWIHAKALYTGNQTAESLVGVARAGIGPFAAKLAGLAGLCVLLGMPRRRAAA